MSHQDIVKRLAQVAVFSVLTDEEKDELASRARLATYNSGVFIVRQGKPGNSLYIVDKGLVEVIVTDPQGFDKKITQTKEGGFFGEMSLLTGEPNTATVRAVKDTTLVIIDKSVFASILKANPKMSNELGKVLSMRQKELATKVGNYGKKAASSGNMITRIKSFFRV